MLRLQFAWILAVLLAAPASAQPFVWAEAEAAKFSAPFQAAGWGDAQNLAGGKWVFAAVDEGEVAKRVPAAGATIAFTVAVERTGEFGVHARIGYEFARALFRWRIDGGAWADVSPQAFTTDLMAIADFAEIAWLKLGTANLAAGPHTLEINVPRPAKGRLLFGLDCVVLSRDAFHPNGPHKPGAKWQTPADEAAAGVVYEFPKAGDGPDRQTLELGGNWQIARFDEPGDVVNRTGPIPAMPAEELFWKAIRVPGDVAAARPDFAYCHRYLYRCKVNVPATLAGRAFVLRFPNNALLTTVFVNGKPAGFGDTPCAAFECDITPHVKPGEVNEVVVGIKDHYYALSQVDGKSCRHLFNFPPARFYESGGLGVTRFADYPTMYQVRRAGILEAPSLTARGAAYAEDVFAIPGVAKKELQVELTLRNASAAAETAQVSVAVYPAGGDRTKPVLVFPPADRLLPANGRVSFRITQPWADAKLWWPDSPQLYTAETTVAVPGMPVDRSAITFGFREWGWAGKQFTLNGVPWHLRADLRGNDSEGGRNPDATTAEWRKNGQNTFRFWGEKPWTGPTQQATLDYFDRTGTIVRRSGIFDGQVASYALVIDDKPHAALFANWRKQLAAWVKAERNHPSVLVWSLENEITYINTRNFGWLKLIEPEIKRAAREVMDLDPTRPVMTDGGDALMDQSLPVSGNHYLERDKRDYPDEAYTLDRAYSRHTEPRPQDPWPIPKDKPLFLGESYFANGSPPAAYAEIGGEAAFLGRRDAAAGVAKFARMLSEGYRWHGVAAFHFWFAESADAEHYKVWQPVCVLAREWDSTFAANTNVTRTLKAFNDTRFDMPITVHWLLRSKAGDHRGSKECRIPPGGAEAFTVTLPIPAVGDAEFVLSCDRGGKEVFRDVKPVRILPPAAKLAAAAGEIALWDPAGLAGKLLAELTAFTPVKSPDVLPAGCKVLVVGPNALMPADATDPKWTALAARGVRVLVLDQDHPLHYLATPADLEPTPYAGRIVFPENPAHPAFAGLTTADFAFWAGDHIAYRTAYRKPSRGARSLAQCDVELSCSALVECPVGEGLLLLSQLAIGTHPNSPAARAVFANLLNYAVEYKRVAKTTAVVFPANDPREKLLAAAGLKFTSVPDVRRGLADAEIVIADATPETLRTLVQNEGEVNTFTARGGRLVLWNLTPAGLTDFNALVGVPHAIRAFKRERVTLAAGRPAVAAGLTLRDVALESAEKIYPWAGDRYPADDTFTHVVDFDDPAPFVVSDKYAFGWSQMTNGLTSADSWKFIFYHDQGQAGERPSWSGNLAKRETLTGISVVLNADYRVITKLRVVFDDNPKTAVVLTLKPERELRQEFTLPGVTCSRIALEPVEWTAHEKPVIGIDNVWLKATRPADFADRVRFVANVGGIVEYPRGAGGILLNQVKVSATEANPENAAKKRNLVATLLRNLGAEFAAERLLIPGENLVYTPVPLGEKCNGYLATEKGWFPGRPELAGFPVGDQTFAGVRYAVRDFKTSPLPAAIVLAGPGSKAVEKQVSGIPVGTAADMLFFLHAFHRAKDWKPPQPWEDKPKTPPVVFQYTVHFADGTTAVIPVTLGVGVADFVQDAAAGLPGASVAWTAGKLAVYQMPWTNPKPGVKIASFDVGYAAGGNEYGVPAVLGVTAGKERK